MKEDFTTYRVRIHLAGGQTVVTEAELPAEWDEDDALQELENQLHTKRKTPYRFVENVIAHVGAISAIEVEAL